MSATKLVKVPDAAEILALSPKTLWQWIGERRIGVVRLGRAVRVPLSEIERLMEEGTTPARRLSKQQLLLTNEGASRRQ
jgi:excisionase family DNA binding protein